MKPTDEELMAYADGELAPDRAEQLAAVIASDPALSARVEEHRQLRRRLSAAYAPVLDEPVSSELQQVAARLLEAKIESMAKPKRAVPRWGWRPGLAMAASLLVGLLLAQGLPVATAPAGITLRDGHLVAGTTLADGLDEQASGTVGDELEVRMSFRDADGQICRVFVTSGDAALAGLACRHGKGWRLPMLMQAPIAADQAMRQAASPLPSALLDAVDTRMAGEPFGAEEEDAAIRAGWRQ